MPEKSKKSNKTKSSIPAIIIVVFAIILLSFALLTNGVLDVSFLNKYLPQEESLSYDLNQKLLREESMVIDVAEQISPSVVTVTIKTPEQKVIEFSPFGGLTERIQGGVEQDIGTGFIVSEDGLIVTNKHVVSDTNSSYKVITSDDKEYEVVNISRDPSNDIAIIKIDTEGLTPAELGDSDILKVGQFAMAVGTALGEFRHTVTTGVVSGLGRGITAGSVYEGYVERLDNVIQTDAAINPGNSGGPLINSAGQVIGINVAVAQGAQNIGFAIPINIVKDGLKAFSETGQFVSKPFLGVRYQIITEKAALLNEVPQGAYIIEVVQGSPAEKIGIKPGDIVVQIAGEEIGDDDGDLSEIISSRKPGEEVKIVIWRDGEEITLTAKLSDFSE